MNKTYTVNQVQAVSISKEEAKNLVVNYLKNEVFRGSEVDGDTFYYQYELCDYHKGEYEYAKKRPATEFEIAANIVMQKLMGK